MAKIIFIAFIFIAVNLLAGLDSNNPIGALNLIVAGIVIGLAIAEIIDRRVERPGLIHHRWAVFRIAAPARASLVRFRERRAKIVTGTGDANNDPALRLPQHANSGALFQVPYSVRHFARLCLGNGAA
jgi:hypothetical protein